MRCFLLVALLVCSFVSLYAQMSLDIFLINITIYQDHEADRLFVRNYPEVYLSCNDGDGRVNLDQVRRVKQLYEFRLGDIRATHVDSGGCVACRLRESDATVVLEDDTFGSWTMCQEDFEETGFYEIEDPGEFLIVFQCPECVILPPPASEPAYDDVEAPPSSEPEVNEVSPASVPYAEAPDSAGDFFEDDMREDVVATYYSFTATEDEGTIRSSDPEETRVTLQNEDDASDGNATTGNGTSDKDASGRTSAVTVLSLCFTFLVVGIAIGVLLFWKFKTIVHKNPTKLEAIELAKVGFSMKKANKW